jgi:hypothetical protein
MAMTTNKFRISDEQLAKYSQGLIRDFRFTEQTRQLYRLVSLYLNTDPEFEKHSLKTKKREYPFSLDKGLFLISAPGAGKSFLFEDLLPNFFKYFPGFKYRQISTYELQDLYLKHGANAINEYNYSVYAPANQKSEYNLYIDDFGREVKSLKFFGNDLYFMDMFIDARARLHKRGFKTHGSSNLNLAELKGYYSDATFSRFFKLFNFILMTNTIDYRMEP